MTSAGRLAACLLACAIGSTLAPRASAQELNKINGTITIEGVGAPSTRLEVSLSFVLGGAGQRTFSDMGGRFTFEGVRAGSYLLTVRAPYKAPFGDGSAEVRVDRSSAPLSYSVTIVLEPTAGARRPAGPGSTLSVEEVQNDLPRDAKRLYKKGSSAAANDRPEDAVAFFRQALAIAPNYLFALNDLGSQLLKLDRVDEAVEALGRAVVVAPHSFSPRLNLALCFLAAKHTDRARAEADLALAVRPDDPTALYVSGKVDRALGRSTSAIEAFKRAYVVSGAQIPTAMVDVGELYEAAGETELAVEAYRTFLKDVPVGPQALVVRERLRRLGASDIPN